MKKAVITAVAVTLALCLAVGGTLAYLTAKTDAITNTFTAGSVDITLAETKNDFKMIPGNVIAKDPKVTVDAASENCWLFVQVKAESVADYLEYSINSAWTELQAGVYYIDVDTAAEKGVAISVLTGDQVTVKTSVTKDMLDSVQDGNVTPKLIFKAFAVQKDNVATATDAWGIVPAGEKLQ